MGCLTIFVGFIVCVLAAWLANTLYLDQQVEVVFIILAVLFFITGAIVGLAHLAGY